MGLRRMLAPGEDAPEIFVDKAYPTLTRSVLSTSTLPQGPNATISCFGPVVEEGFG